MKSVFELGLLIASRIGQRATIDEGQATNKEASGAVVDLVSIESPDDVRPTSAHVGWANGAKEVGPFGAAHGQMPLWRPERGGPRTSTNEHGLAWAGVELPRARVDVHSLSKCSNLYMPPRADLREGAELDVYGRIRRLDVTSISAKGGLLHDTTRPRGYLVAEFRKTNKELPVPAYQITRVRPLQNEYEKARSKVCSVAHSHQL